MSESDVICPACADVDDLVGNTRRTPRLRIVEYNYSTKLDIAECPNCGGVFQISYKVDQVTRLGKEWES